MTGLRSIVVATLALWLAACATLSPAQREQAAGVAAQARASTVDCDAADACAQPSPLRRLAGEAFATSTPEAPRHYALILDHGPDALLARINLIRSATTAIDLQTYIFDEDDAGRLVIDELLAAARRGVRVRLLLDQLAALEKVETLAALAGAHANFEVRVYNPVLGRARISYPQYALAAACCWRRLNQRMHSKALLIDGSGHVLARASAPLTTSYPHPGWAEQSAADIWASVQAVIARIVADALRGLAYADTALPVGHGEAMLLITVLACFLGGIDPFGGHGRVVPVVLALIILQVLSSGLNLIGANQHLAEDHPLLSKQPL